MSTNTSTGTAEMSAERKPSPWVVLRDPRFARLWLGGILTQLAVQTASFAMPLILFAEHRSARQAGTVGAVYAVIAVAARIPAGVWVDRWNRKRTLLTALLCHVFLLAAVGAWVQLRGASLGVMIAAACAGAIASAFYSPTQTAIIRAIVPRPLLAAAMSQYVARQYVAGLAGPALGGLLLAWHRSLAFLVPAGLLLLSTVLVSTVVIHEQLSAGRARKPFFTELGGGLRFIAARPAFCWLLVFTSALTLALSMYFFSVALHLLQVGVATSEVGVVESVSAGALIAGAVLAPWLTRRVSLAKLGFGAALLLCAGFLGTARIDNVALLSGAVVIMALPVPAADAAATAFIVTVTPGELQGRVGSTVGFVTNLFTPLAPVLVSAVLSTAGARWAVAAAAVPAIIATAAMLAPSLRASDLATAQEGAGA
jgi:MFS family permease